MTVLKLSYTTQNLNPQARYRFKPTMKNYYSRYWHETRCNCFLVLRRISEPQIWLYHRVRTEQEIGESIWFGACREFPVDGVRAGFCNVNPCIEIETSILHHRASYKLLQAVKNFRVLIVWKKIYLRVSTRAKTLKRIKKS